MGRIEVAKLAEKQKQGRGEEKIEVAKLKKMKGLGLGHRVVSARIWWRRRSVGLVCEEGDEKGEKRVRV